MEPNEGQVGNGRQKFNVQTSERITMKHISSLGTATVAIVAVCLGSTPVGQQEPQRNLPVFAKEVPVATVVAFAGVSGVLPRNWLPCWGQSLRRDEFRILYSAIGTAWGEGDDPGNTFSLPDMRGYFLRGVAHGRVLADPDSADRPGPVGVPSYGGNTGDKVGSYQEYASALPTKTAFIAGSESWTHNHSVHHNALKVGAGPNEADDGPHVGLRKPVSIRIGDKDWNHGHSIKGGDKETRPRNAYVEWIIKVKNIE